MFYWTYIWNTFGTQNGGLYRFVILIVRFGRFAYGSLRSLMAHFVRLGSTHHCKMDCLINIRYLNR
jgi:hypothetical protein